MKPCPYCGHPMSIPRRVQCGSPECRRQYNRDRNQRFRDRFKSERGKPYFHDRRRRFLCACIQCGNEWQAFSEGAKYCSSTCQAEYQHGEARNRKLGAGERRRAAVLRRLSRYAKGSSGRTPWVVGGCSECGSAFAVQQPMARTCSSRCAESRQRKRRGKYVDDDTRLAIYDRDGWTCQLCFGPVNPVVHYLDDWAASLDHIVCRSWAEVPDHSPENLRLAHRWCNSVRGDESHYDPAVLAAA